MFNNKTIYLYAKLYDYMINNFAKLFDLSKNITKLKQHKTTTKIINEQQHQQNSYYFDLPMQCFVN